MVQSDVKEVDDVLACGLDLALLSFRLVQVLVLSASGTVIAFSVEPAILLASVLKRRKGDFEWILHVELLHDHLNFLHEHMCTLNLISSCLEIMCFDRNSQVLNFLSQNMHFQMSFFSSLSLSLMNFSIYYLSWPI